jgi:hypothetical protein
LVDRIRLLASIFAIDICSYAVMSNHYHIVVKLGSTDDLNDDEVITRWLTLHKGPLLVQRLLRGDQLEKRNVKPPMILSPCGDSVWPALAGL